MIDLSKCACGADAITESFDFSASAGVMCRACKIKGVKVVHQKPWMHVELHIPVPQTEDARAFVAKFWNWLQQQDLPIND